MERKRFAALAATAALAVASAAWGNTVQACDRPCLAGALDAYLGVLAARDPARAPIADTLRSTENGKEVRSGEGLWRSVSGLGPLQRRYFDPESQQAAFYGLVQEAAGPALVSLRIKVAGGRVVESEALVARKGEMLFNPAGAVASPPRSEALERGTRLSSRSALTSTATAYFDALQGGDPLEVPKVDGCERVENGTNVTRRAPTRAPGADEEARGDCTAGLNTFPIAKVAHRRMPVVDTEAGVILGIGLFQRPPGAKWRDGSPRKRNLIHEYFALDGGRITQIFAVMRYIEQDDPDGTGWPAD